MTKRRFFEWGGVAAGIVLVAFGIAAITMGIQGRSEVRSSLAREAIVGSPDMTPSAIKAEAQKAGLDVAALDIPSMSVAGEKIDTGSEAKAFAAYMRIHALESTQGETYAQMGRFLDENGKSTNDEAAAAKDPESGRPVENGARNIWVTETALSTALNTSFMAERLSIFGLVVGVALLLSGVGFLVLALGGALRRREAETAAPAVTAVPAH